ncbi:MAG: tRNA (adenosine(37)-N6)-dimethylallyltransferase MiaA [Alphaproteobacteria bacterium]
MTRPVLIVAGPTASGKSHLALAIAEAMGGTIINADSMQIYRELAVLTARPEPAALARVPHRLYGVLPVSEACSAGRWRTMALAEIESAHGEGRLPVVTGGSGLYLQALVEGIATIPEVPAALRARGRELYAELGPAAFRQALAGRDPASAGLSDRQRLVRAWEVLAATGRPLAAWQQETSPGPAGQLDFAAVLIDPPRAELYAAIERRLDAMMAAGALDEVAGLVARGVDPALPALRAVGIAELARHLAGELPLAAAVALAKQASRRLAKRQLTWLRHHQPARATLVVGHRLGTQLSESLQDRIFNFIRQNLLTVAE